LINVAAASKNDTAIIDRIVIHYFLSSDRHQPSARPMIIDKIIFVMGLIVKNCFITVNKQH
jgi:hypothetical protein